MGNEADPNERTRDETSSPEDALSGSEPAGGLPHFSREQLLDILNRLSDGFFALDAHWRVIYLNHEAEKMLGQSRKQIFGKNLWDECPETRNSQWSEKFQKVVESGASVHFEEFHEPLGLWLEVHVRPSNTGLSVYLRNVTQHKQAEEALKVRSFQRATIAEFGQLALAEFDLERLLDRAVEQVAETLQVEYAKVLELHPEEDSLLLKAGVGWKEGFVGEATVGAGEDSQAGYTLLFSEPVIVEDLKEEDRFSGPPLLTEHGVVSGISVAIHGDERPYGVLGAHTIERRSFTESDVNFLRAIANVLAAAIQRHRAEEATRESEERYRTLYDHNPMMYLVADTYETILSANKLGARQLGYAVQDLVGRSLRDLIYEEDEEVGMRHITACLRGTEPASRGEFRKVCNDGSVLWVRETARAVQRPGDTTVIFVVCEDISEDKERRERLEEQARLLELTRDAIIACDLEGVISFWNRGAEEMYGWTKEAALGENCHEFLRTRFPRPLAAIRKQLLREGHWEGELAHTKHDGAGVIVASRWALQRDEDGEPQAFLEINTDITKHRQAQEALLEIREAERRRIAWDLHDVVLQDLSGALQSLQFTQLRSSSSGAELDLNREIETLRRANANLRRAIYELRFAKEQPFKRAVESLVDLNRKMKPERDISLTVQEGFPEELPDPTGVELLRVIQEALANTRRHSDAKRVHVSLWMDGGEVHTEVADNGRGFDPETIQDGIGLSVMRERVEALGGELEIQSRSGGGALVKVRVPYEAPDPEIPAPLHPPDPRE